ncbi:MAG: DegT/DnrJ/EryC1/StrS family aminotransferase [Gammaproteobacteria bacterium]|nr:DegT/DnrJ/EryC1/StrS family aminotransferase [Gammaproteobacteria bacterium]
MRLSRTLPPAAAPLGIRDIVSGIHGLVHGPEELERFRSELKEYFGVKHCFLVSSGKAALTLVLLALKDFFPSRDEVLIPAFTCYSVPSSIIRAGLKIRLCDLDPNGLDFDFVQLSALLSEASPSREADTSLCGSITDVPGGPSGSADGSGDSTKRLLAVIPTHLFGLPADVPRLRILVRNPEVTVVEDAAQAMGETLKAKKLGTLGDVSFFSLGRGKAFSTVEGGVILTDRDDIGESLKHRMADLPSYGPGGLLNLFFKAVVLTFFLHPRLFWIPGSLSFLKLGETRFERHFSILRMSSFQAGLARNWRARHQKLQGGRKKNVSRWIAVLEARGIHGLRFQDRQGPGLIRFPVRVSDPEKREWLLRESARRGLGVMPVYPNTIDRIAELRGHMWAQRFPVAESYVRELVTLPTHDFLTDKDVKEVSKLLSSASAP